VSTVSVRIADFPGAFSKINGWRSLSISKQKLIKFAVSMGQPLLRTGAPTPAHAIAFSAYKALAVKCSVNFNAGVIGWPSGYKQLDPTEKANISYWTGMSFAALLTDEYLGVARLLHASSFKAGKRLGTVTGSRKLPDLIGEDKSCQWHVVEAKARQSAASSSTAKSWKAQSQAVTSVNRQAPATRSYSFTRTGPVFMIDFVDPPHHGESEHIDLVVSRETILTRYYGAFRDWLSGQNSYTERGQELLRLRRAAFDPVESEFVYIGMTERAFQAVHEGELPEPVPSFELPDTYMGSDGLVVLTSPRPDL